MVTQKFTEITEILASFLRSARAEGTFCDFRDFCVTKESVRSVRSV